MLVKSVAHWPGALAYITYVDLFSFALFACDLVNDVFRVTFALKTIFCKCDSFCDRKGREVERELRRLSFF